MEDNELKETVQHHSAEISILRSAYERHNSFLFGQFDEHTTQWIPGFAQRLSDAVIDISEIRSTIARFVAWMQASVLRIAIVLIGSALTGVGSFLWFLITHWSKITKMVQ